MQKPAALILLPNALDPDSEGIQDWMPETLLRIVPSLDGLISESEKLGRKYLKRFCFPEGKSFRDVEQQVVCEHTTDVEVKQIVANMKDGSTWGLISDAGLPCLADPGAKVVAEARRMGKQVQSLTGPSSIVLALMLSGLSAQRFLFEGYLPKSGQEQIQAVKAIQMRAMKEGTTTVFIETPYRCAALFSILLASLDDSLKLCVAQELTTPHEKVQTYRIKEWKSMPAPIEEKKLCVFVVGR